MKCLFSLPLHSPWPWPFAMRQEWAKLLFIHRPVSPETLQEKLPASLVPDCLNGMAWLSVVSFQLTYWLPGVPWPLTFNELNLRTYVKPKEVYNTSQSGVYFFCLDANDWLSVEAARAFFTLNYLHAKSTVAIDEQEYIHFQSIRQDSRGRAAEFAARYRPESLQNAVLTNMQEHTWLTERYRLYSVNPYGELYTARLSHPPWKLEPVCCSVSQNTLWEAHGFNRPTQEEEETYLMAYAEKASVLANPVEKVMKKSRPF
jgi:uncharacterized protein